MKVKKVMDETTNRYEFNRCRKMYLEQKGKIRCCWCGYHVGENQTNKWYGVYDYGDKIFKRYPNWKLSTKNKKQWMDKSIKTKVRKTRFAEFTEFLF